MKTHRQIIGMVLFTLLLVPLATMAQVLAAPNPDDLTQIATFLFTAIKGGDWSVTIFAGLVLLVSVVRKMASKVPTLAAFLATDLGGAVLTIATVVPVAFLAADLAGQPLTFKLAVTALGGSLVVFTLLRKILRPLVALVPKVGPVLVSIIDFVSGAVVPAPPKVVAAPVPSSAPPSP